MAKMGRPTKRTPEIERSLLEHLVQGGTLKEWSDLPMNPSYVTVWRWQEEDADFRKLVTRARHEGTYARADEMVMIAKTTCPGEEVTTVEGPDGVVTTTKTADMIAHRKLQIETFRVLNASFNARQFGQKTALVGGDPDDPEINVKVRVVERVVHDPSSAG